jgi:2-desacetyl-2-hydroxyethyl bacteriochlorophyllide A dehydrogenase
MASTLGVVAHSKGDLRVEEVEIPDPRDDESVVDIAFGGICGTDVHYWKNGAVGDSIIKAPMLLGHEIVGTVVAAAADGSGPQVGARVAVHPATEGGTGRYPADRPNISPGATYLGSAMHFPHTEGAFAKRVPLPSRMLRVLPDNLSLRDAAIVEPASVAWRAVSRAGDLSGKRVLVVGAGPIGALVIAILKRAGAAEIVAIDIQQHAVELAARLGATETLLAPDETSVAAVDADIAIDSSGSYRGFESAVRGVTRGGRVIMVGMPPGGEQPALLATIVARELEVFGSFRFNDEIDEVIAALADGSLVVDGIVTHEFALADALEAFEVAADASRSTKVVLTF